MIGVRNRGASIVAFFVAFALLDTFAAAQCQPFFNKADFDAFNQASGKQLKGIETFEEANIPPGGKQPLPAPLEGNVPNFNPITGFGFPNGLTEKNLLILDNITPGPNPPTINPSGSPMALYVLGVGFLGANSTKIGEDLFLDGIHASLDLLFTEPNHTGVGFDLSRFQGGPGAGWIVTVFDKNNNEIGRFDVPPPPGPEPTKSFFGIWCEVTIGRINVFDIAGPEPDAIDNIQMWVEPDLGICLPFFSKADFDDFNASTGKLLKGIETFEESNIPQGGKQPLFAPLEGNVPNVSDLNGFGFPNGLDEKNIIILDNITPGPNPPTLNPSGSEFALFVIGEGFLGSNSKKVGEDMFLADPPRHASLDLIFTEPNHTGIGFDLSRFKGFPLAGWHVSVFNKDGGEIGKFDVPEPFGPEPNKAFFGIWCEETIGRINIFDFAGPAPDAIDNIQMWVEPPPECIDLITGGLRFAGVYCTSSPTTNGVADISSSTLKVSISAPPPQFTLWVDDLPILNANCQPGPQPGIFIASDGKAAIPFFNGTLCLSPGGLQRMRPVLFPDLATRMVHLPVDIATQASTPTGGSAPLNVVAGAQYNFQYWTRDPCALMMGQPTAANFSSAIGICFNP